MPFCPECRAEYIEGTERCPDCNVLLVDELPPKDVLEYVELVEIASAPDEVSGVMMKGILENSGIDAVLRAAKIPWYNGIASTWSEYYWGYILVPIEEKERAKKILDEYLESIKNEDLQDEETL